jgi:hypothetical protein
MKILLIPTALVLLTAAGCGGSDDDPSPTAKSTATSTPTAAATTSAYVTEVNQLCRDLIDDVVPITGNNAPAPTRETYLANRTKLLPVYETFDAAVDAVPVETDADREADKAFDAYRAALDAMDADLVAKADLMENDEWMAAEDELRQAFFISDERNDSLALGIECPAR